ncbi:hypothetical protein C943_01526 [Mariniradius saccharolyticus AK6]|uniref:Uncharacterized protein n=1 Tax=Mariniradius saccharolyticus AK6 TaxID=1239962 RepID=M7XCD0_9BACT|nr:hypothetical protein C943_01526 [Mariniradius saccharolyticus AK6]
MANLVKKWESHQLGNRNIGTLNLGQSFLFLLIEDSNAVLFGSIVAACDYSDVDM